MYSINYLYTRLDKFKANYLIFVCTQNNKYHKIHIQLRNPEFELNNIDICQFHSTL